MRRRRLDGADIDGDDDSDGATDRRPAPTDAGDRRVADRTDEESR